MLDSETRRRIDTARDILVGKVPDPKSQVEQITIALIYKFMNDMDMDAEAEGGKRKFFVGEYEKYSWSNLMSPALGGFEVLGLYSEAIERMTRNNDIPALFRDIFKNAYLPYRDPETLKLFLKTINEFTYDHSEKLGDAFEYLLSVLGSQGDAGQFRTPRHIIDFMVKVIDPQKDETILDPACGTAGFLISAYKHILTSNSKDGKAGAGLKPAERKKLANNIFGYDISPDMVRLSLVNLYLHGFTTPNIVEYDSLTSDTRWNETADVILANPPFMSPKGGIQPHKRFSVQSNRSEVLFVDYMAEHLTPNGRAAIIVPEGIIFQSAGAYKQLRKYLIEHNYLWAVVSLPAGVFNPYAGVKTSILFLDKALAKKTQEILFVKVEADGFDLGAQRRPIDRNDLPQALKVLETFRASILEGQAASFHPMPDSQTQTSSSSKHTSTNQTLRDFSTVKESDGKESLRVLTVSTSRLAENEDYNLSADRYREVMRNHHKNYPMVAIGDICTFEYGKPLKAENRIDGEYPVFGSNGVVGYHNEYLVEAPFLVVGRKGSAGEVHYSNKNGFPIDTTFYIKLEKEDKITLQYLFHILKSLNLQSVNTQAGVPGLNRNDAYKIQIPLPPLEIQRQLVDEIAAHQRIIDGARQVVEGWKPNLELNDDLETAKLGDICDVRTGKLNSNAAKEDGEYPFFTCSKEVFRIDTYAFDCEAILLSGNNASGDFDVKRYSGKFNAYQRTYVITIKDDFRNKLDYQILQTTLESNLASLKNQSIGGLTKYLTLGMITSIEIPLPPLEVQREIVARIERERSIVEGNRELIRIYEEKVKKVIERVWES